MKTIYKYEIPKVIGERFRIPMALGAETISFQNQNGNPVVWAKVDLDYGVKVMVEGRLMATGEVVEDKEFEELEYFGTAQFDEFVFHLFFNPILVPAEE